MPSVPPRASATQEITGQPGTLFSVGNGGYCWSASGDGTSEQYRGICLDFYSRDFSSSSSYGRAIGFRLRCLSE
ncbi:hypothetical protein [uncultured Rikenella sp.]|uniref:hypothetical protein n=1 Tax=uncultured Rikenella sp. TaxID=368003 RepID=UPI00262E6643|nr:hypothetical protein [uncultured Rikenella sp.]